MVKVSMISIYYLGEIKSAVLKMASKDKRKNVKEVLLKVAEMIDHFDFYDRRIDRTPDYSKGQQHTDYGQRGSHEVNGIKFSDLYQAVSIGIKESCFNKEEFDNLEIDPEAVAQNITVNVEKLMGIYPNISKIEERLAKGLVELPTLEVGDTILIGKWKNRRAIIKGFGKDENNQPIVKTDKGDVQMFKFRIPKLMK